MDVVTALSGEGPASGRDLRQVQDDAEHREQQTVPAGTPPQVVTASLAFCAMWLAMNSSPIPSFGWCSATCS